MTLSRWMRRGVFAVAALGLASCDGVVMSLKPLFTADDASLLQLKPGVWEASKADCTSAEQTDCSFELVVTPTELREPSTPAANSSGSERDPSEPLQPRRDKSFGYTLASGDPMILQLVMTGAETQPGSGAAPRMYFYATIKPLGATGGNEIKEAEVRAVDCGPAADDQDKDARKRSLYPGMKALEGQACTPASPSALRDAAAEGASSQPYAILKWVRAGDA